MLRLVALILLILPSLAVAAPVFAFLASPALFAGTTYAISWGAVIFTAASLVYGQAMQRKQAAAAKKAQKRARDQFNANLRDRTISGIATERAWTFVYGQARVGANVVAMFTKGSRDEYKYVIAVLAQHECESIDEIYINGKALSSGKYSKTETVSATETVTSTTFTLAHQPNSGTVKVTNGTQSLNYSLSGQSITLASLPAGKTVVTYQYTTITGMARVVAHLGGDSDPADADFMEELGDKWPATAVLRGHAYLAIRLNLNQAEFQDGLPQIEALVKGKKILDVRTGVKAYDDNPVLVAYDYLTSEMGGVPATSIPVSSFIAAANDCDDIVSTGSWSGKRYTFNGTITSDQSRDDVLEKIAQSMAGGIVATTWDIYAGKFSAPVKALYQSDIVGEVAVSPGFAMVDVFNTVKGQFISQDNEYVATDYKPYQNAAYLVADGEELATDIDLPYTDSQQRCTNLARIFTEDNRNGYSISANFSLKAWGLRVGQRVTFTSSFFGHSAKIFRVTDKSFAPDRSVHLGLKEDAESTYDLADEVIVDVTPNTDLPDPYDIDPLVLLSCVSGASSLLLQDDGTIVPRIQVTWPQATTQGVLQNGLIEVEWQRAGFDEWEKITVSGDATTAYLSPVQDGQFYTVRARCVNQYVNVKSDWAYAELHSVTGKGESPADVTGFFIQQSGASVLYGWDHSSDSDLSGYEIRFNQVGNHRWEDATPLTRVTKGTQITTIKTPPGDWNFMIKARNNSGFYSENAGEVEFTVASDLLVVGQREESQFWEIGTLTNFVIHGNRALVPKSTELAYDAGWDTFDRAVVSPYALCTYESPEIDIALDGDVRVYGAPISGLLPGETGIADPKLVVDYRTSDGTYDGYDSWQIGFVTGRYFKFKCILTTHDGLACVRSLKDTIDADKRSETWANLAVPAAGLTVTFAKRFFMQPTITPSLVSATAGSVSVVVQSTSEATFKVFNTAGTAVAGVINLKVEGT